MLQEVLLLLRSAETLMVAVDELRSGKGQRPLFVGGNEYTAVRDAVAKLERRLGEEEKIADGKS